MSTQRVDGKSSKNRSHSAENVPIRSRSDHGNLGRNLGGDAPPKMRSPAAANGRANRKPDFNTKNSTGAEEYSQPETALAAAMRAAMGRKAVRT